MMAQSRSPAALPAIGRLPTSDHPILAAFLRGNRPAAGLLFIAALTCVMYLPALRGEKLWDDNSHITRPELRSAEGLYRIWFEKHATQQYYPLLHSAFWVEHRLWG